MRDIAGFVPKRKKHAVYSCYKTYRVHSAPGISLPSSFLKDNDLSTKYTSGRRQRKRNDQGQITWITCRKQKLWGLRYVNMWAQTLEGHISKLMSIHPASILKRKLIVGKKHVAPRCVFIIQHALFAWQLNSVLCEIKLDEAHIFIRLQIYACLTWDCKMAV